MMSLMLLDVLNYQSLKYSPKILKFENLINLISKDLKYKTFDQIKTLIDHPNAMWFIWKQFYLDVLNKHVPVANLRIKVAAEDRSATNRK